MNHHTKALVLAVVANALLPEQPRGPERLGEIFPDTSGRREPVNARAAAKRIARAQAKRERRAQRRASHG